MGAIIKALNMLECCLILVNPKNPQYDKIVLERTNLDAARTEYTSLTARLKEAEERNKKWEIAVRYFAGKQNVIHGNSDACLEWALEQARISKGGTDE